MGYCVFADVQTEFKNITFTPTSNVTDSTVTSFIAQASALIDSVISSRYQTPITQDATALALLQYLCITLVSDRIRNIIETKQQTNTDGNANARGDKFDSSDVMVTLNEIKDGEVLLSGATLNIPTASFFSNNAQGSVSPRFQKNRRQW
jgi:phage gp36-like protein